jgi:hypothetical protein
MLHDAEPGSPEEEAINKSKKAIDAFAQKITDFQVLASTLGGDAPLREAYKAVFGEDRPDLDPNTPEGMRMKNEMNALMGKSNG